MKIVGQVSTKEEAQQCEDIARVFVINTRIRTLATQARGETSEEETVLLL